MHFAPPSLAAAAVAARRLGGVPVLVVAPRVARPEVALVRGAAVAARVLPRLLVGADEYVDEPIRTRRALPADEYDVFEGPVDAPLLVEGREADWLQRQEGPSMMFWEETTTAAQE